MSSPPKHTAGPALRALLRFGASDDAPEHARRVRAAVRDSMQELLADLRGGILPVAQVLGAHPGQVRALLAELGIQARRERPAPGGAALVALERELSEAEVALRAADDEGRGAAQAHLDAVRARARAAVGLGAAGHSSAGEREGGV